MVVNADQSILLGGYSPTPNTNSKSKNKNGKDDYIALKISDKGNLLWERTVGSKGTDMLKTVIETRDGGYLMAGTSMPTSSSEGGLFANAKNSNNVVNIGGLEQTENQEFKNAKDQLNAEL